MVRLFCQTTSAFITTFISFAEHCGTTVLIMTRRRRTRAAHLTVWGVDDVTWVIRRSCGGYREKGNQYLCAEVIKRNRWVLKWWMIVSIWTTLTQQQNHSWLKVLFGRKCWEFKWLLLLKVPAWTHILTEMLWKDEKMSGFCHSRVL